jgi:hypothetical protein
MNIRYYKIVNAEDVEAGLADSDCVTSEPRYSIDKTKALLKYKTQVAGSVSHAEILEILQTSAWSEEIPLGIPLGSS